MLRTAKPKLSLSVPAISIPVAAPKSPFPLPISPSPINSPTARNTLLNQRGHSTLQPPTFAYAQNLSTKSILKRAPAAGLVQAKRIAFTESPMVKCVSPMPEDYHGEYVKMSKDERRWGSGARH